jgi:hypothetical protein
VAVFDISSFDSLVFITRSYQYLSANINYMCVRACARARARVCV